MYDLKSVQAALNAKGFKGKNGKSLTVDGISGEQTDFAIVAYKKSVGLRARPYVGPITFEMLVANVPELKVALPKTGEVPPWYEEMLSIMGKHETNNYTEIKNWLDEDGIKLGDQRRIPWCGAAVSSALNNVGVTKGHPANPNAAISWMKYGIEVTPRVGALMVQHRGDPSNWQGHIGFYAGESSTHYYLLGGNQGDSVNITPFRKSLLRAGGCRWPSDVDYKPFGVVKMSGGKTTKAT